MTLQELVEILFLLLKALTNDLDDFKFENKLLLVPFKPAKLESIDCNADIFSQNLSFNFQAS